jgi:hypothetical protein
MAGIFHKNCEAGRRLCGMRRKALKGIGITNDSPTHAMTPIRSLSS